MLLAHVHPDQLQQRDSEVRMLFEIRLQYGKLDGVDLGGTARNRTKEIGRLILVDRQLPDETPPSSQDAAPEHAPMHRI